MNRDRTIIVVLVVLLAISLFFNVRGWHRARSTITALAPATTQPAVAANTAPAVARKNSPAPKRAAALYEVVPNAELKGTAGRIVVAFAEGVKLESTRTAFYQAGSTQLNRATFGATALELPPGSYHVYVFDKEIRDVPVESGKDTRVHSGVLRLHGARSMRFSIYDVGVKDKVIHVAAGDSAFGLPAGEYEVEVDGQRQKFTIQPGKITDL